MPDRRRASTFGACIVVAVACLQGGLGGGCTLIANGELSGKPDDGSGGAGGATSSTSSASMAVGSTRVASSVGPGPGPGPGPAAAGTSSSSGITCPAGKGNCDGNAANGCETDLTNDVAHCGACGHACGAHQACAASACVCEIGYGDCDGMAANGCEASLLTDPNNCGTCKDMCKAPPKCLLGKCQ